MYNLAKMGGILFLATVTLAAVSCTKNSNEPDKQGPTDLDPPPPPVAEAHTLPVKIVVETDKAIDTYTIAYLPDTDKIEKITKESGSVESYQYKDDLIEKIQYGASDNGDFKKFEYDNSALVREIYYRQNAPIGKTEYGYPSGTSLATTQYKYENEEWKADGAPAILEFDANGNLIKGKGNAGDIGEVRINLTYDNNNTSMINVGGWSKINFTGGVPLGDNISFEDIFGRRNNPINVAVTATDGSMNIDISYTYEFNDTENPKFPTQITGKENNNVLFTAKISYK